jgi:hypothetical protein
MLLDAKADNNAISIPENRKPYFKSSSDTSRVQKILKQLHILVLDRQSGSGAWLAHHQTVANYALVLVSITLLQDRLSQQRFKSLLHLAF